MQEKQEKILVSFDSTTDAMAMESFCTENNIEGRMIPLPKDIDAGCGIAWISPYEIKNIVEKALEKNKLSFEKIQKWSI